MDNNPPKKIHYWPELKRSKHRKILVKQNYEKKYVDCSECGKKLLIYTQIVRVCSALSGTDRPECYEIGTPSFASHFGTAGI